MPTINALFSHQISVIMGDYLYSRAVIELVSLGDLEPLRVLSRVTNEMTVGEMRQLLAHDPLQYSEEDYDLLIRVQDRLAGLGRMRGRRAASGRRGAAGAPPLRRGAGHGVPDRRRSRSTTWGIPASPGSPSGSDLREHKVTLPLIAALPKMGDADRRRVADLLLHARAQDAQIHAVVETVPDAGGLDYARERALRLAQQADAGAGPAAGLARA